MVMNLIHTRRGGGWVALATLVALCLPGTVMGTQPVSTVIVPVTTAPTYQNFPSVDTYDPVRGPYGGLNIGPAPTFGVGATMPTLSEPLNMSPSQGFVQYIGNGTTIISNDIHCDILNIKTYHKVLISGDVTFLVELDFTVMNHASIELLPGATLTIYVKDIGRVQNYGLINSDTSNPYAVTVYNLGTREFVVQNYADFCGTLISPNGRLQVENFADFYGCFQGQTALFKNLSSAHFCAPTSPPTFLGYD